MSVTLNIQLPDDLTATLATRARDAGFTSVEAFVEDLVRAEALRIDYGAPGRLRPGTRAELEALIREGVDSPAREIGPADWQEMRRLVEGHRQQKAG